MKRVLLTVMFLLSLLTMCGCHVTTVRTRPLSSGADITPPSDSEGMKLALNALPQMVAVKVMFLLDRVFFHQAGRQSAAAVRCLLFCLPTVAITPRILRQ